jgi:hypothetical protein
MKTLKPLLTTISILSLAVLSTQVSPAQPTNPITKLIVGPMNVLWDFSQLTNNLQSEDWTIEKVSGGQTNGAEVAFDAPFAQDAKGKLFGSGPTTVDLNPDLSAPQPITFPGNYVTKGSVTSSKGVARVTLSITVSGRAVLGNDKHPAAERAVTASAHGTLTFNANTGQWAGRASQKAAAAGIGAISETKTFGPSALPAELGDGTWTLVLSFEAPTGNKLKGTATVTLNTGQVYPFDFTGTYASHNRQSKLNLKGSGVGSGSILQVMLQDSNIIKMTGRVAGQSVNIK